ncbi:ABC transporter permease [Actinopolymorpha rutila]|uniref:Glycine betaine/proline transport system permease protein n=1 Tax=Actinopolymorpha rutila TaxID=446787 RepID=A0A852ZY63_9ACTN|nr:glycine betaine/proline transport system permease protein [Actinopolymorpha rutila]
MSLLATFSIPRLHVGELFAGAVDWLVNNLSAVFDAIGSAVGFVVDGLAGFFNAPVIVGLAVVFGLLALALKGWKWGAAAFVVAMALGYAAAFGGLPPAIVLAVAFGVLGLALRGWKFGLFAVLAFLLIDSMGLWKPTMDTLALVLVASVVAVVFAIPIGIAAGQNDTVSRIVKPVLDFMQTMPGFVYLIPAIFLFGVGVVPGVVATVIFAMAPGVRLTELGIRQVDREVVEAGESFGAPPGRILGRIQIPLALPTIMAGINQVIMLALSMVVIAGLVGAGGLGGKVYTSISTIDLAGGFEAGLAVVVLAVYLDRLTASLTSRSAVVRAQSAAGNR